MKNFVNKLVIIASKIRTDVIERVSWQEARDWKIRDIAKYGSFCKYKKFWVEIDGDRKQLIYCQR